MDTEQPKTFESLRPMSVNDSSNLFSSKNMLIGILCVLLILSFLGINLLNVLGNLLQEITRLFKPLVVELWAIFVKILAVFGYTTGVVLNKSADIVGDTTKTGIDIAEGTVHSVGNILMGGKGENKSLDNVLKAPSEKGPRPEEPVPDSTENPIQNPISVNKSGWCLVGEYKGRRGCIEVSEQDKCLSGQVYPSQKLCLNPVLTPNV